jgi:hypothetical protein
MKRVMAISTTWMGGNGWRFGNNEDILILIDTFDFFTIDWWFMTMGLMYN